MLEGDAAQLGRALENRAEALGDADRGLVLGPDKAREALVREMREQPVARGRRGLGRKALVPEGLVERIGDLRLRPVERLEDADAADEAAARDLFAGPHAVAAQRTRPGGGQHRVPDLDWGRGVAGEEIAHDLRV